MVKALNELTSIDLLQDAKEALAWPLEGGAKTRFERIFGKYHLLFRVALICIGLEGLLALALLLLGKSGAPQVVSNVMLSAWTLPFLSWMGMASIKLTVRKSDRPTFKLWRLMRLRQTWLLRAGAMIVASGAFGAFFGMVKSAIPQIMPFYADDVFVKLDRQLLGQDAWQLSDRLLGDFVTAALDRCYLLWFPAMFIVVAYLFSTRNERLQARGLFAFFAAWFVLGTIFAILGASVGPIFYDQFHHSDQFSGLLSKLDRVDKVYSLDVGKVVTYLADSNAVPKLGGGIAAMPSMHVGIAFLNCLVMRERGGTFAWVAATIFFIAIFLGSIDLGWHYLVDGLAAVLGVYGIWRLSDWIALRIERTDPRLRQGIR